MVMEVTADQAGLVATNIIGHELDTVTAQECEVTNGFVKNGTSLPYIIETSNSGEVQKLILTVLCRFLKFPFFQQATKNVLPKFYRCVVFVAKSLCV